MTRPRVVVFRPADERLDRAVEWLRGYGAVPVGDPMLEVVATGRRPRGDAEFVVFTSVTGVELAVDAGWEPARGVVVCAIGPETADRLRAVGVGVDVVPETYSSAGLVDALGRRVAGARVEVARSDHGSAALRDGLDAAGAYHHETVLYELRRPEEAGSSVGMVVEGEIDAVLFTSSLTVEYFLAAADEQELGEGVVDALNAPGVVVGAIGRPTRETAEAAGLVVDVVPGEATFAALAEAVMDRVGHGDRGDRAAAG